MVARQRRYDWSRRPCQTLHRMMRLEPRLAQAAEVDAAERPPRPARHDRLSPRLFGDVDVLSVDHLEDRARARAVAHLVHGDFTRDAGKALEPGEATANLVAVGFQIGWIVGHARLLDAVFVGIDDVIGAWPAVGRFAAQLRHYLFDVGLHLGAR